MSELRKNISHYTGYLHLVCSMWVFSSLMFRFEYQRLALYFFSITYVLDYVVDARWRKFQWNKTKWLYVAMITFYLIIHIWNLWAETSSDTPHYTSVLGRRLPFLAMGLMGLLGISDKIRLKYFAYTAIFTSLFAIFFLLFKIGLDDFLFSSNRFAQFAQARIQYIGPHMMFNMYLNCALLSVFYLLMIPGRSKWHFVLLGLAEGFLMLILLTTDGRTGFMTAIMLHAMFLLYGIWIWKRKLFKYSVITMTVVCVIAASLHPRASVKSVTTDTRYPIWKVVLDLIEDRPLLGYGVNDSRIRFLEQGEKDVDFFKRYMTPFLHSPRYKGNPMVMHPHNAYLEALLEFGVFGLVILLFILIFPLVVAVSYRRIYIFLFLLIFSLQLLFEVLGAHCSPLLLCYGLLLWQDAGFDKTASTPMSLKYSSVNSSQINV